MRKKGKEQGEAERHGKSREQKKEQMHDEGKGKQEVLLVSGRLQC